MKKNIKSYKSGNNSTCIVNTATPPASVIASKKSDDYENHVFPFKEPELRISDWELCPPVSEYDGTVMVASEDFKGPLSTVINNRGVPLLVFTAQVWQELQYLTNKFPKKEWGVFVTLKKMSSTKPHFLAFDWFMPGQKISGVTVDMSAKDAKRYFDRLKEKYPYYQEHLQRYMCHLHSHHSMTLTTFSGTDDTQQFSADDLGFADDFRFYVVVTTETIKASLVIYKPALVRINAAVAVTFSDEEYAGALSKKRMAEIDQICKDAHWAPPAVTTPVSFGAGWAGSSFGRSQGWDDDFGWQGCGTPFYPKNNLVQQSVDPKVTKEYLESKEFPVLDLIDNFISIGVKGMPTAPYMTTYIGAVEKACGHRLPFIATEDLNKFLAYIGGADAYTAGDFAEMIIEMSELYQNREYVESTGFDMDKYLKNGTFLTEDAIDLISLTDEMTTEELRENFLQKFHPNALCGGIDDEDDAEQPD